jgi:aspartate-semialdehyde dehydrogenase
MGDGYRIAVVGATGAVGGTVLEITAQRASLPIREMVAFASERSVGVEVPFGDQQLVCRPLADDALDGFDLVFSAAGGSISREWAPKFAAAGALVIDKTSYWRTDPQVPLVVPEVNPDVISDIPKGILSSPNCSTMQLVVALNPIRRAVGLEEIVVSTYQSVSGSGRVAVEELEAQAADLLAGRPAKADVFPHQVAFNAMPQVETFQDETNPDYVGYSTEELKIMRESRRIFGLDPDDDAALPIHPTCVRLGIKVGHSQSIRVRTTGPMSPDECRDELRGAPGITVVDDPQAAQYPMAIDAAGIDDVLVGRIRRVPGLDRALNLWVVGDNLRKGAALNAVQIAELLHARGAIGTRAAA